MANPDLPNGFEAAGSFKRVGRYERDADSSVPICPGDIVFMAADGNIDSVGVDADSQDIVGAALTFATGSAAKTDVMVADDPHQVFIGQDDGVGITVSQAEVGGMADVLSTAGSVSPIRSNHEIDISGASASAAQLRLMSFVQHPEYTVGNNSLWEVMIGEHLWGLSEDRSGI
jgi:hypothetical protein